MKILTTGLVLSMFAAAPAFAQKAKAKPAKTKAPAAESKASESAPAESAPAASENASYSKGSYGMAGCGLGSLIIKNDNIIQVLAATTNGSSYSQTFGITTGTSNCKPSSKLASIEQKVFVEANYAQLSREAAQGEGEHLKALAELLGCDHAEFAKFSKANRDEVFAQPETVIESVKAKFPGQCERVG